jgi:hypothetical protein
MPAPVPPLCKFNYQPESCLVANLLQYHSDSLVILPRLS